VQLKPQIMNAPTTCGAAFDGIEEPVFASRRDAGVALAARLRALSECDRIVVGIANGGLEVGAEVAKILRQPLEAIVVQSISLDGDATAAPIGAVAEGEAAMIDRDAIIVVGADLADLRRRATLEAFVGRRRAATIRRGRPLDVDRCAVTLVSDMVTDGLVELAALGLLRKLGAERIVLATPVAPEGTLVQLAAEFDAAASVVRSLAPAPPSAWFGDARPLSDAEARRLRRSTPAWRTVFAHG
jgi:putative phosphoribosyl transferase